MNFGFAFAGAMVATSVCHPLDVARVRVMVSSNNGGHWGKEMMAEVKTKGISSLWTGLSAGLLRQAFYGTTRFGCFETLMDWMPPNREVAVYERFLLGCIAGACAGLAGNPADVALTRMASDLKLPKEARRNYRNGVDAMVRIGQEEGLRKGLLCGAWTNVQRSVLVNGVMLGTYGQSKEWFKTHMGVVHPIALQLLAGTTSGFCTAVFAVPADFIKTNLQHRKSSTPISASQLVREIVNKRGVLGLWRGFLPFFLKLAPHTTISFMVIERLKAWRGTS